MVQRVVPDGRPEIILNLAEPFEALRDAAWRKQPQCFLAGQITGPLMLRARGKPHIIGIRLRPGGLGRLLGIPASDCTGHTIDAGELGLEALRSATSIAEAEQIILQRECGTPDVLVHHAVDLLSQSADVGNVAAQLNLSPRQLERRFRSRVGMPPKHFARIARFQRVFRAVEVADGGWVQAAAECGYYDQAHLIRDFRELAGAAPTHLLAGDELARHFLSHFSKTQGPLHA